MPSTPSIRGGYSSRGNRGSRGTGRGRGGRGRAGKWVFQADEPSKVAVARKMSTKKTVKRAA